MFNFNNFKKAAVIASLGLALTACGDKDNKETASNDGLVEVNLG